MSDEYDPMQELGLAQDKMLVMEPQGVLTHSDPSRDLCAAFIPHGGRLYDILCRYDMIATLVLNSTAGNGCFLKYVQPFLKAYGATDYSISKFYADNLTLADGAAEYVRYARGIMPVFFSTMMLEHASDDLCAKVGMPLDAVGSVPASMDAVDMDVQEARDLRKMAEIIVKLSLPKTAMDGTSPLGLSNEEVRIVSALDKIFKGGLAGTAADRIMDLTGPMGITEKAYGLLDIRKTIQVDLDGTMYVSGEQNDFQAMQMVREGGGLALSFNGSEVNVEAADVAVVDDSCYTAMYLSAVFFDQGGRAVIDLAENWSREYIRSMDTPDPNLRDAFLARYPDVLPEVYAVCPENTEAVAERSSAFRAKLAEKAGVRGRGRGRKKKARKVQEDLGYPSKS